MFRLRDQVSSYELFKEQIKAVQDEQVKILSDKVAELDSNLMVIALHIDEELYPRFLTTIAGQMWILDRGLKLVVMKCLQSLELRDQVSSYELFKEQIKAVQNEQVKILSDKVAELDSNLMVIALHIDEELYPRFLTTIAGQMWILDRGLKLVVMKCLQSILSTFNLFRTQSNH
nr:hypothetical protein [Tanacetum cinerariifolium]